MKYKTTLFLLFLALLSGQVFADYDQQRGQRDHRNDRNQRGDHYQRDGRNNRNDRDYRNNRNNRGNRHYDQKWNRKHQRGYGRRHNGSGSQYNYGRLMYYSPDRFARWYADTAISQIEKARNRGCRFARAKGRWRYNWRDHYQHGLKQRRETSIREVEQRDRELADCRRYGHSY